MKFFIATEFGKYHIDSIYCTISMFTDQASNGEQEAFVRDCYLTRGTNHENVACIIATVLDFPPLLIYTDLNDENLKRFLLQSRTGNVRICQIFQ